MMQVDGPRGHSARAWRRWALLFGLPSAAVALASVWLYEPHSVGAALEAAGLAVAALLVFTLTMPRRRAAAEEDHPQESPSGDR
jgi:hypothetical protein